MMKVIKGTRPNPHGDTAAASYHLSDTLDWSSLSAQIKNRVIVVPVYVKSLSNAKPPKQQTTEGG